jgi:hypothetical protein
MLNLMRSGDKGKDDGPQWDLQKEAMTGETRMGDKIEEMMGGVK